MFKLLFFSPFSSLHVQTFLIFTIPNIKAVILPLIYVTLLISSWNINTSNLTFKMDFFYIIIRIQDIKHPSNSPCAKLYLLLYIKSSSQTTVKLLTRSHQETQDRKSTTSSTRSGSGINFYSQIHKDFILPVPVIMPANPGTTYIITRWQCCCCLRADTDPVYGAGEGCLGLAINANITGFWRLEKVRTRSRSIGEKTLISTLIPMPTSARNVVINDTLATAGMLRRFPAREYQ
jgi:hypothetical protein